MKSNALATKEPIGVVERAVNVTNTTKSDSPDLKEFSMTTRIKSNHHLFHQTLLILIIISGMLTVNVYFAQSASRYGIRYTLDVWTGAGGQTVGVLMPRSVRLSGKDKTTQLKNLFNQMKQMPPPNTVRVPSPSKKHQKVLRRRSSFG